MQGDEMKGRKTAGVFTAMDGSEGWKRQINSKEKKSHGCCGRVPWLLVRNSSSDGYCGKCI